MAGLREKKKLRREQRILDAAEKLFTKKGFDGAGIEEIAEAAEVGVGTVYNYFKSKDELLVGLLARDTDRILADGGKYIESPPEDPVEGIALFLSSIVKGFSIYPRALMREVFAAVMTRLPQMDDMIELDFKIMSQLGRLLSIYREKRLVNPEVEIQDAVWLLYSATWSQITLYAAMESIELEHIETALRRQVSVVFKGLGRRQTAEGRREKD